MYVTLQREAKVNEMVNRVRRTWLTPLTLGFAVGAVVFFTTTPI
jgi:hypothetical protein